MKSSSFLSPVLSDLPKWNQKLCNNYVKKGERKKCNGDKATLLRLEKAFEQYPIVKKDMVSPTCDLL